MTKAQRPSARFVEASSIVGDRSGRSTDDLVMIPRRASSTVMSRSMAKSTRSFSTAASIPTVYAFCRDLRCRIFALSPGRHFDSSSLHFRVDPHNFGCGTSAFNFGRGTSAFNFGRGISAFDFGRDISAFDFGCGTSAYDFGRPISAACAASHSFPGRRGSCLHHARGRCLVRR